MANCLLSRHTINPQSSPSITKLGDAYLSLSLLPPYLLASCEIYRSTDTTNMIFQCLRLVFIADHSFDCIAKTGKSIQTSDLLSLIIVDKVPSRF
mmetsp:Transcript_11367/g.28750  ORF Transcript_11367/g.28750 Transcript_11367/m.28750 type:complete len:95 (+) Transcript_11367:84-368(+)